MNNIVRYITGAVVGAFLAAGVFFGIVENTKNETTNYVVEQFGSPLGDGCELENTQSTWTFRKGVYWECEQSEPTTTTVDN